MKRWVPILIVVVLLAAGCQTQTPAVQPEMAETRMLRVMTYSSFDMDESVIEEFNQKYDVEVQFLDAGDTGRMLNQAILSTSNPQADVMYGLDNTFLSRALDAEIFVPYQAKGLENVPLTFLLGDNYHVTPVDYGDVCLNVDLAYFDEHNLALPQDLLDLTKPEYKGLLVVENPATSSPGLAFLIATIGVFGEDGYVNYWESLRENDVLVVEDWDSAYWGEFSGSAASEGQRPIVVSYATSPAAEVYFSEEELVESPTGAVISPGTCFRQVEFAGILKNNQNQELAEAFIEFVLEERFQNAIPLHMWVFPVSTQATLPQVFEDFAVQAEDPVLVPVMQIEQYREQWIETWTDVVLR